MGKRKKKKFSSSLTWKTTKGIVRLVSQGFLKAAPLLLLMMMAGLIFWGIRQDLYADPGFGIQTLEIVPSEILSPAKHEELQKLCLRQNLFKLSLERIQAVVEQDPQIREARVIRKFPKTLRVELIHRKSFAQIQFQPEGPFYSVSDDGVVLSEGQGRSKSFILIEALESQGVKPEVGRKLSLRGLEQGIALARAFWSHPLARSEKIENIRIDHLGNVALALRDGPELRFGFEPSKRLSRLSAVTPLIQGPDRKRIIYIDLQYQDLIVKKK